MDLHPILMLVKATFLVSILLLNGCTYKTDTLGEIRFGEYASLTGSESAYGIDTHRGIEMAVNEQNEKGGILGKKIRLITYDDQGKTDEAVTAVTRLIVQDKVHILLGEVASTRSIAAGSIAQKYKVPMISPASTNSQLTKVGNYIFRVCFIDDYQGDVMAKFALEHLKLNRGSILSDLKSDYSLGLAESFQKKFNALGGTIVSKAHYASGDLDFKSQAVLIKKSAPDFLFIPGYYTEVGLIARHLREQGFKGIFLGGDGWDSEKLLEIGKEALIGSYFANHYFFEMDKKGIFATRYKRQYRAYPNSSVALGYDATQLAIHAIEKSGSMERAKIRDQLAATQGFEGVTGTFSIDRDREVNKPAVILKIKPDLVFSYLASIN